MKQYSILFAIALAIQTAFPAEDFIHNKKTYTQKLSEIKSSVWFTLKKYPPFTPRSTIAGVAGTYLLLQPNIVSSIFGASILSLVPIAYGIDRERNGTSINDSTSGIMNMFLFLYSMGFAFAGSAIAVGSAVTGYPVWKTSLLNIPVIYVEKLVEYIEKLKNS